MDVDEDSILTAVASRTKQLFVLLKCISFSSKVNVEISKEGLRFTVDETRVMQGMVFVQSTLFSSFIYNPPSSESTADDEPSELAAFQISLTALLEALQIFGSSELQGRDSSSDPRYGGVSGAVARTTGGSAFDSRALGTSGICRISYGRSGDPLSIFMEEAGVITQCELATYEPEFLEDIPFHQNALEAKIIMKASSLYDAITELGSSNPSRVTFMATPQAPFLALSAEGPYGSAIVEFGNDPEVLEVFRVQHRTINTYKYSQIKHATRAMGVASKVCLRSDAQGVLSLQFLIEIDGPKSISFVDFVFIPFLAEDGEHDESDLEL